MALIWKILQVVESTFRRLKGAELLLAVYAGAQYIDGVQRARTSSRRKPPDYEGSGGFACIGEPK